MNRVLGVDFGRKRVGVAISDPLGVIARPLEVIEAGNALDRIAELVAEYEVGMLVVGLPRPLAGGDSASSVSAREMGTAVATATGLPVVYVDERYTSKMAEEALLESGLKRRDRRERIDKVAAALILQSYLDGNFLEPENVEDTGAQ